MADRPVPHGTWAGYRRCTTGDAGRPCVDCRSFVSADVARRRRERQQGIPPAVGGAPERPVEHGTTIAEAARCRRRPGGGCAACAAVPRRPARRGGETCQRCHQLVGADHVCPERIGYRGPSCPACGQWLPSSGAHECAVDRPEDYRQEAP